jgi:hypothetical protein
MQNSYTHWNWSQEVDLHDNTTPSPPPSPFRHEDSVNVSINNSLLATLKSQENSNPVSAKETVSLNFFEKPTSLQNSTPVTESSLQNPVIHIQEEEEKDKEQPHLSLSSPLTPLSLEFQNEKSVDEKRDVAIVNPFFDQKEEQSQEEVQKGRQEVQVQEQKQKEKKKGNRKQSQKRKRNQEQKKKIETDQEWQERQEEEQKKQRQQKKQEQEEEPPLKKLKFTPRQAELTFHPLMDFDTLTEMVFDILEDISAEKKIAAAASKTTTTTIINLDQKEEEEKKDKYTMSCTALSLLSHHCIAELDRHFDYCNELIKKINKIEKKKRPRVTLAVSDLLHANLESRFQEQKSIYESEAANKSLIPI